MYMDEHKQYSSIEAYEVAEMAKAKGLTLLEGNYMGYSWDANDGYDDCKGYGVAKVIAGRYLTLTDDSYVYQRYVHDGPYKHEAVWFDLTLEQAKELIVNFDGTIKDYPTFFAFIRVYDGEPEYYGQLQLLYLEEFARKHGITYKEKFVCSGGKQHVWLHPENAVAIDDVICCCEKSFSQMTGNAFLVVSDMSRLNDELYIWRQIFDIIPVNYYKMDYTEYNYHESEELKKAIRDFEKDKEDGEYEAMCKEHREMMLEQDQPFIEAEEEEYA